MLLTQQKLQKTSRICISSKRFSHSVAMAAVGLTTSIPFLCCSSTYRPDLRRASGIVFRRADFSSRGFQAPARRIVPFVRAAQSSTKSENVADDQLEITKQRLRELSESLALPAKYLERLPSGLRVDLKDAAFALSSGALNSECGEQAGDLLKQLSQACERGDTQAFAASARQLPTLVDKLSNESSSQFVGGRFIRAGRYFTATGQYEGGELEKIGKALISAGEAFTRGKPPVAGKPISTAREFKFGDLQVDITAQRAYIGAAFSLVFGLLSWQITSGLQNQSDSSYANDNPLVIATSLRGSLLSAGYFCTALAVFTMVGLIVLGITISSEKKE